MGKLVLKIFNQILKVVLGKCYKFVGISCTKLLLLLLLLRCSFGLAHSKAFKRIIILRKLFFQTSGIDYF